MRRVARGAAGAARARCSSRCASSGPLAARDLAEERPRPSGPWWDWSESKKAIELLFWSGEVTSARRRNFERIYDLPERVLPKAVLDAPTPSEEDAQRELIRLAAIAMGVAAEPELRDYFRLPVAGFRPRLAELVEARGAAAGRGRGLGPARLPAPRRPHPAPRRRPRAARPVRQPAVGAQPRRAAVRLPLPARDLRPEAQARLRLLRAAVPARRPDRRPRRPQGRPPGRPAARARGAPRARRAARDGRGAARGARAARGLARPDGVYLA